MMKRATNTNKYDYGHALLLAGRHGTMGCAVLAARAAMRSGCGLLTVHLPSKCVDPMQTAVPEAMVSIDSHRAHWGELPPSVEHFDAVAVGPGIGLLDGTKDCFGSLLEALPRQCRLVLDADALTILAHRPDYWALLSRLDNPAIITPHDGEYRRLFGNQPTDAMAERYGVVIVRKGYHAEVCSPDGQRWQNPAGNPGMATAGCGDVLTGVLLGLSAQKNDDAFLTACRGVLLHSKSADLAVEKQTEASLIASDVVENLRFVSVE